MKLLIAILFCLIVGTLTKDTAVRYVHLALTHSPSEMMVGWYTEDATSSSTVVYGLTSGSLSYTAKGNSSYWRKGYGYNHFALLKDLKPNTKYFYKCGDSSNGMSNEFTFTTAPDTTNMPFTIAVYGDMGITNSANTIKHVMERAKNNEFSWIFHVGDISYADVHILEYQKTWNTWFGSVEPLSATMPYMVCPGNHEYHSLDPLLMSVTKNFVVYNARFMMPQVNNVSKSMYYSFDYGNAHFISYSTETSFPNAPYGDADNFINEMKWLEDDLRTANLPENRKLRPWIIIMGHRPIYSSAEGYSKNGIPIDHPHGPPSNSATLQKVFEDLFMKYRADIVFNGHVHSYERNFPAYKNKKTSDYTNPKSPFNIVVGCAGNVEGLENNHESHWDEPQPVWSAHRYGDDYGYGILSFNNSHVNWKFYRAADNGLEDQVDVYKTLSKH